MKNSTIAGLALFETVLTELKTSTECEIHVELKRDHRGERYPGIVRKVLDAIHVAAVRNKVFLTSFYPDDLVDARETDSTIPILGSINHTTAGALGGLKEAMKQFRRAGPDCVIAFEKSLLHYNYALCRSFMPMDLIGAWVVNDDGELIRWLHEDIRQVTTDRPDRAMALRTR